MGKSLVPVYAQLPGVAQKIRVGAFTLDDATGVGEMVYDKAYLESSGAYALDPVRARFPRPRKCLLNRGVYGVLRDAGPDTWGRDMLLREHGVLSEIEILRRAPEDGAGNISFHAENRLKAYSIEEIDQVSSGFPPSDEPASRAVYPTTSMGGAKPKLLAYDAEAFWIAKFPEKGDPEYKNAANEHAMLEMAKSCGIEACDSRLHVLPDGRKILLVRRFDLDGSPARYARGGFASAHTVLGMGDPRHEGALRSYVRFRHEAKHWTKRDDGAALWRRLAFNALVSNTDDHARNHALVFDGAWRLSKAFDIVATPGVGLVRLCLGIHAGGVVATPESLILSADEMGIEREEAVDVLVDMAAQITAQWRSRIGDGMAAVSVDQLASAFRLADEVLVFDFARVASPVRSRRYKPRR
jgi:serine/threonine-protein kinase HipA